jgi:hypothetical protein
MMSLSDVGEVISDRQLFLLGEDPPVTQVRVLLGKPRPVPEEIGGDYYCPIQVVGIGDQKVQSAFGVDAFQSLELAIQMIGYELHLKLNKKYGGKLRWTDEKGVDFGFPLPTRLI